jgi:hypothetical protein
VTSIKALSPGQDNFVERSEDFSLSDWWCCVLKHAEEFDVADLDDEYEYRRGNFVHMPEPIYNTFRMLRRETWGPDLQSAYDRDDLEIEKYSTAIAVERAEGLREGEMKGRREGEMKGFIGEFIAAGKLSRKSLRDIKQNSPSKDEIGAIWAARDREELSDESGEEEEVPAGRILDDFIAYLKEKEIIREEEEEN